MGREVRGPGQQGMEEDRQSLKERNRSEREQSLRGDASSPARKEFSEDGEMPMSFENWTMLAVGKVLCFS